MKCQTKWKFIRTQSKLLNNHHTELNMGNLKSQNNNSESLAVPCNSTIRRAGKFRKPFSASGNDLNIKNNFKLIQTKNENRSRDREHTNFIRLS